MTDFRLNESVFFMIGSSIQSLSSGAALDSMMDGGPGVGLKSDGRSRVVVGDEEDNGWGKKLQRNTRISEFLWC